METRTIATVNSCIYCGSTQALTDEHAIPLGLNGVYVLKKASCISCNTVTTKFEHDVLRRLLRYFRAYKSRYKTRRKKEIPELFPVQIRTRNGQVKQIKMPISDWGAVAFVPHFAPPRIISGKEETEGIEVLGGYTLRIGGLTKEQLGAKYGITDLHTSATHSPVEYARMLAKIAYCFTVAEFGHIPSENYYVIGAILGKKKDIGTWVGCRDADVMPKQKDVVVNLHLKDDCTILVRIKFFGKLKSPTYEVVVGKVSKLSARQRLKWTWSRILGTPYAVWVVNDPSWDVLPATNNDFFDGAQFTDESTGKVVDAKMKS